VILILGLPFTNLGFPGSFTEYISCDKKINKWSEKYKSISIKGGRKNKSKRNAINYGNLI